MDVTNLKQAQNKIEIMGLLAEKELSDESNESRIAGSFSIKIDDLNTIKLNFRADRLTKKGDPNPSYDSLKKFYDTSNTIASVGEENATKVYTNHAELNPYFSTKSNTQYTNYRVSFIGEFRGKEEDWKPKAEASVEVYINAIIDEMDKEGEPTGRVVVKGWMPTYSGIEPLTFIAPEEIADAIRDGYEMGQTVLFIAMVNNSRIEKKKEIPMRIGKKVTVEYSFTNELIITGASEPYDEDSETKPYDAGAIKQAIQEREAKIKEASEKAASGQNVQSGQNKPSGKAMGRTPNWM